MGVIIATLIGCGKTHLMEKYGDNITVLDLTPELKNAKELADQVRNQVSDYDIVFVRADIGLVDALCDQGTDFDLFYPSRDKVNEIVEGLVIKRLDFKAIQKFDNDVPKLIEQLDTVDSNHCFKHKLERGQYLCTDEQLKNYLESFNNNKKDE